jgi:crotonobetainyl-CoA:carnitine CoA-transferase CaiB-like acyl-CoA transferase
VLEARGSGQGCDVDVSLFDVALSNLNYVGAWQLNAGAQTERLPRSAHPSLTPCQLYTTADGWIYLMCNKEKFWRVLCQRIGRPDLAARPEFRDYASRLRHRDALTHELDAVLRQRATDAWMQVFGGHVPAAPVRSVAQALEAAGPRHLDSWGLTGDSPALRLLRSPLRTSRPAPVLAPAPALGADTESVLADIGIDAREVMALRQRGVV